MAILEIVGGETPKMALDYDRNYGIRPTATLLSRDYDLFVRKWKIGINPHVVLLDASGVIRSRCSSLGSDPEYCGKPDNPRCQGHDRHMREIVKELIDMAAPVKAAPKTPKAGPTEIAVAGGWSKAKRVSADAVSGSPSIAADARGNAVVAWTTGDPGAADILWSTFKGGKWSAPASLPGGKESDEYDPQLACDASGCIHAVFVSNQSGPYDIWYASSIGGKWSPPKNLTGGAVRRAGNVPMNSMAPRICVLADGRVAVVWYTWGTARMGSRSPFDSKEWPWTDPVPPKVRDRDLYISYGKDGEFTSPAPVSDPDVNGAQDHTDPAIAPLAGGGAWLAWSCDHPETFMKEFEGQRVSGHILGRRLAAEGAPGPIVPVSPPETTRDRFPELGVDLAADRSGALWAVWDSNNPYEGPSHRIVIAKLGKDAWDTPQTVAEGEDVMAPRVFAMGKSAIVLWESISKDGWKVFWSPADAVKAEALAEGHDPTIASGGKQSFFAFTSGSGGNRDVYVSSRAEK